MTLEQYATALATLPRKWRELDAAEVRVAFLPGGGLVAVHRNHEPMRFNNGEWCVVVRVAGGAGFRA